MIFRTQDKKSIITCGNVVIMNNFEIAAIVDAETYFLLGKYNSEEECLLVLDEIERVIGLGRIKYQMPEEAWHLKPVTVLAIPMTVITKLHNFGIKTIEDFMESNDNECSKDKTFNIVAEAIMKYKEENNYE